VGVGAAGIDEAGGMGSAGLKSAEVPDRELQG